MVEINRKTSGAHLYFFNLQPREVFCRNQAQEAQTSGTGILPVWAKGNSAIL
jgi:hypothetical protein